MIEIYKRVEKSTEHLHGVEQIEMTDKPFILCLSAQDYIQSVCGMPKVALRAARVYSDDEDAGLLRLEDMQVDFLGVRFSSTEKEQQFVDQFLFPYLISHGTDLDSVRRDASKVNFLTYCDGVLKYKNIEELLIQKLSTLNFTDEEVTSIVSNITLVATSTNKRIDDLRCTSIKFRDINDDEVSDEREDLLLRDGENYTFSVSPANPNSALYIYRGNGEHSIRAHLNDDCIAKPVFCAIIISMITKAFEFDTLTNDEMLTLLEKYSNDNIAESHKVMDEIDRRITYDGVRKYDAESLELKKKLDSSIKTLASVTYSLECEKDKREFDRNQFMTLRQGIGDYCSNVTRKKLLKLIGYQFSEDEIKRIDSLPSDKEFVEPLLGQDEPKPKL